MSLLAIHRNLSITRTRRHKWDGCVPKSNDERRAEWAARFYGAGHHNQPAKPRIRVR